MPDKEEVFEFLDVLRETGATNMFGATPYISEAFEIGKKEATKFLVEWMKTYETRHPVGASPTAKSKWKKGEGSL